MPFHTINHPLILDKLTRMRRSSTDHKNFREILNEISTLMAYEIFRDISLEQITVETDLVANTIGYKVEQDVVIFPILRAGLGMVDGILNLIPNAKVGHIGIFRNEETLEPTAYFSKSPKNISDSYCLVLDPMLATGKSLDLAIQEIKKLGGKHIKVMCLVASPEGKQYLMEKHPEIEIYASALDQHLNHKGYIVPGLGDAGDRLFGTK